MPPYTDTHTGANGLEDPPDLHPPPPDADPRSVGDLFRELAGETSTLLRQEVALAKTEIKQEVRTASVNLGSMAAGGAVAYAGLIVLLMGLGTALGELFDEDRVWLGLLIVGLIAAVAGYVLVKKGLDRLKAEGLAPERTITTLKEDKQWLQNETRELKS
jgi:hypothetical protein